MGREKKNNKEINQIDGNYYYIPLLLLCFNLSLLPSMDMQAVQLHSYKEGGKNCKATSFVSVGP